MAERAHCRRVFVLNAVNMRARITSDAVIALSQHGTVAPVFIQQRTDFATSMIDGCTICELDPAGRSGIKIAQLWEYLAAQLEKQERQRVFHHPAALGFGRRAVL
jgi:chromosome partitioning protein